jgi:hypothetical protein
VRRLENRVEHWLGWAKALIDRKDATADAKTDEVISKRSREGPDDDNFFLVG